MTVRGTSTVDVGMPPRNCFGGGFAIRPLAAVSAAVCTACGVGFAALALPIFLLMGGAAATTGADGTLMAGLITVGSLACELFFVAGTEAAACGVTTSGPGRGMSDGLLLLDKADVDGSSLGEALTTEMTPRHANMRARARADGDLEAGKC